MTSEIKVDTISEQTSANGVTIDGLTIKDGNIQGSPALVGTTPSFTIGDGGAEDTKIVFDGNALDYYIGLDDSADNLIIGSGSTVGSNSLITIDSDGDLTLDVAGDIILDADGGDIRFKDAGTEIAVFENSSSDLQIKASVQDKDIIFRGNDGGSGINALTLDMSDAGKAIFNSSITSGSFVEANGNISTASNSGKLRAGASNELELSHNGSHGEIDVDTGNLTLDVVGDIILDVGGGDIKLTNAGTNVGEINLNSNGGDIQLANKTSDKDLTFHVSDGGSIITALQIDGSDAGTAIFNHDIKLGNDQIAKFGAAANLQIYANSINSFITESGSSGNLKIQGQTIRLEKTTEEIMLRAVNDGQVELYYDNVIKVLTSSTGINLPVDGDSIKFGANSEVVLTHVHNAGLELSAAGNLDTLKLVSTDDDANVGPVLNYYRNSGNVADNDYIGRNLFTFNNDAPEVETALAQNVVITDASNGSEDVKYIQEQMTAGSIVERFTISSSEAVFNEGSVDVNFRVESNGNGNMIFVDGGNDSVHIGSGTVESSDILAVYSGGTSTPVRIANTNANTVAPSLIFHKKSASPADGDEVGLINFIGQDSGGNAEVFSQIVCTAREVNNGNEDGDLGFGTKGAGTYAVRMTVQHDGMVGIGTHEPDSPLKVQYTISNYLTRFLNQHSSDAFGIFMKYTSCAPDGSGNQFFLAQDSGTTRMQVLSDGDVQNHDNSYGSTSDERIKQDIRDSNSQWDDIKAVKVRNFKKKDDVRQYGDNAWEQIGVVAQELEAVSPKLIRHNDPSPNDILSDSSFGTLWTADDPETQDAVEEVLYTAEDQEVIDGAKNVGDVKIQSKASTKQIGDVKEITEQVKRVNYSILYMKAIKALQEAQTRIETLETKVAALEG